MLSTDREDRIDYRVKQDFLERLTYLILTSPRDKIGEYLKPLLDDFKISEGVSDLLKEFISAEDYLGKHENFWEVWNLFKEKIIKSYEKSRGSWYMSKVIKSYLFGRTSWKEGANDWHSLKDENKPFFNEVSPKVWRLSCYTVFHFKAFE